MEQNRKMTKFSEDRGLNNWDTNSIEGKSRMSLMSRAEQNISSSCQHLEQTFKDINCDFDAPCPIKLVRRLTSLEIALSQLKKDCEMISTKRRSIVQSVIADQNKNVEHTMKVRYGYDQGGWEIFRFCIFLFLFSHHDVFNSLPCKTIPDDPNGKLGIFI